MSRYDPTLSAESVPEAYNRIADQWCAARRRSGSPDFPEKRLLQMLVAPLPQKARILDAGCGGGEPIAKYLAEQGFSITGIDAAYRLIRYASAAVSNGTFIHGDMRSVGVKGPFDAVVAWDSVFHLPRADHAALFKRFWAWLRPGGRLLLSLGGSDGPGFTSQMFGETFYYSGFSPSKALAILKNTGFQIEHWEVDDPSSKGHIAILAVRA